MQVKYVVMPISIEQKKEYNRQGFRVVDARFAPADAEIGGAAEVKTPRRQRREKDEG
ncbi:hypothetical protein SIPHO4S_00039 [Serratia phage Tsm2]|uniref:Uncharacterized protein n=1 Tax=Serratia phage Tsm2 TaxID=2787014 RepID=A0A7S9XEA2_9CAUD|nr:hypothetical protein PF629_gp39 [Serratia phage Tsm2]QPI13735.1 hypothetical protein SIPHO4S_00039 [Serratia phage Tsm2]